MRNETNGILRENLRYIWFFIGAAALSEILTFSLRMMEGWGPRFEMYQTLISLSMIFIPVVAVNTVYLFKVLFARYVNSDWKMIALKTLGMYIGVVLATITFQYIYHFLMVNYTSVMIPQSQVTEDVVVGYLMFSIDTTNIFSNLFYATIVGLPVFIRQQLKQKSDNDLARKGEQIERVKRLNTQAQLEALQAKVNPHFLYNSLNSIAELIHNKPDEAEKMVLSLSELFRYSMKQGDGHYSNIQEEIEMVRTYMSIEKVRFGENLSFEIEIEKGLESCQVPKFLLQPIVENAIKHGTSKLKVGKLHIRIFSEGDLINICVTDNGPAFPDSLTLGYGMKSVMDQLEIFYPKNHDFQLLNDPLKMVLITIPKKTDSV